MAAKKSDKKEIVQTVVKPTDLEKEGLKGNVWQVKQICYQIKFSRIQDELGKIENQKSSLKNYLQTYDENGAKTEEQQLSHYSNGTTKTLYNSYGKISEHFSYKADGSISYQTNNTFDAKGNMIETYSFYPDGKLLSREEFNYDEKGNQIERRLFERNEKDLKDKKKHRLTQYMNYDDNGFRIEFKNVNPDGTIGNWITQINNDKGHYIVHTILNPDGSMQSSHKAERNYDKDGNLISPFNNNKTGFTATACDYENDEKGNWIKKTIKYNRRTTNIIIRDINYYSEHSVPLTLPIEENKKLYEEWVKKITNKTGTMKNKNETNEELEDDEMEEQQTGKQPEFSIADLKWLSEGSAPEMFAAHRYYVLAYKAIPSSFSYPSGDIEALALKKLLVDNLDATVIYSMSVNQDTGDDDGKRLIRYTLNFPDKEYILSAFQIQQRDDEEYDVPAFIKEDYDVYTSGYVHTSQLQMYHPSDESGKRDEDFELELEGYIDQCTLQSLPETPQIYMVQVSGDGNFALAGHAVDDSFEIKNLDMNYGYGFERFHNELMGRFKNESKGLVLFHGEPGTGKTYYIRHLLRSMADNNKIVIYMPPNMVDHLVEPGFMTFISQQVASYSEDGYFCVLLIEDAEPLLAARSSETRVQGVTNLLNMTDGLLNDMLNLQIICTFNVGLKKLDKALLRPGRLLARKEFKAMSELDANRLAQQLGIKHHFTAPTTLAEVYALVKNKNTLIHDVDENGEDMS